MTSDPEHLASTRHQVSQEHDVSLVNDHPVRLHRVLDLVHDGLPGSLDAEGGGNLECVIRLGVNTVNTWGGNNLSQIISWKQNDMGC